MTCYVSPLYSRVKGESHASVCGSRSHTLIPTGARSRPAALPKPIIISVPRPHCWKGSASKPYVELPPHTAPLGMEVGPAQACAVKVVVHDLIRKRKKSFLPFTLLPSFLILIPFRQQASQRLIEGAVYPLLIQLSALFLPDF